MSFPERLWLVGCGNMGGAMLARWIDAGLNPAGVTVIDPGQPAVPAGVRILHAPPADERPEVMVLAVKPQMLDAVQEQMQSDPQLAAAAHAAGDLLLSGRVR